MLVYVFRSRDKFRMRELPSLKDDIDAARQSGIPDEALLEAYRGYDPAKADDIDHGLQNGQSVTDLLDQLPGAKSSGQGVLGAWWASQSPSEPASQGGLTFADHLSQMFDGNALESDPSAKSPSDKFKDNDSDPPQRFPDPVGQSTTQLVANMRARLKAQRPQPGVPATQLNSPLKSPLGQPPINFNGN